MWSSALVGFDVAGVNEFFPARKFGRLIRGELLWRVGHAFKTQLQEFGLDLGIVQTGHDGSVQFGFDVGRQPLGCGNGLP